MESVRLVQFTDTHLFGDEADSLRGIPTLPALKATLRQAQSDIRAAAAILVTGDLVQDDPAGYPRFRELFGKLGKPILTLPGNHDDVAAMRAQIRGAPFQYCGHRDFAGWRIIMVDSFKPNSAGGHISPAALSDLRAALASSADQHVLVCLHHHPIPMRSRWLDTVGLENADEFFAALDAYSNVRAVLWGHVHQTYDAERRGVRLLATPSTCAQFLPHSDDFAVDPSPPAYRILELTATGAVHTEVLWLRQSVLSDA